MSDIDEKQKSTTGSYREGLARVFGDKPTSSGGRKRYRYDTEKKEMVEIPEDWTDAPRSTGDLGKFQYDNMRATDGADISSRTKYKDYLKATGLTPTSDFKNEWAQAAKKREEVFKGTNDKKQRREAIERAIYQRSKP